MAGHISRSHGVDGTILIIPVAKAANPELFDDIDLVRLQNKRGDLIPARINSVRTEEKKDRISFFVKFDHINDRHEAEEARGTPVFIAKNKIEDKISKTHSYIAFDVFDDDKRVGSVEDVIKNPAHPILSVSTDGGTILIPFADEYVVEADEADEKIYCKNLQQLKNL